MFCIVSKKKMIKYHFLKNILNVRNKKYIIKIIKAHAIIRYTIPDVYLPATPNKLLGNLVKKASTAPPPNWEAIQLAILKKISKEAMP